MGRRSAFLILGVAGLVSILVAAWLCLALLRYGPLAVHALRTGEVDFAQRPDRAAPRFSAAASMPAQAVVTCSPINCPVRFEGGGVASVEPLDAGAGEGRRYTGHFSQRAAYRIWNQAESYDVNVAVAYRPSTRENRLGDDVDTTEAWEHLAPDVNLAPLADRVQWAVGRRDAHLLVTAYDGETMAIDIRQPVEAADVLCDKGVVLFGPAVGHDALVAELARCLTAQ